MRVQRRRRPALLQRDSELHGPGSDRIWDRLDSIRTGMPPVGALWARWARPDLTDTGVLCCRVRSTTDFGDGGCSLPLGYSTADPGSYSSASSCRTREGYFRETTTVASDALVHDGGQLVC